MEDTPLKFQGKGHTGLHVAAYGGHFPVVAALIQRGANVDVIDKTWGHSAPDLALTGWERACARGAACHYEVVALLVNAGATVRPDLME